MGGKRPISQIYKYTNTNTEIEIHKYNSGNWKLSEWEGRAQSARTNFPLTAGERSILSEVSNRNRFKHKYFEILVIHKKSFKIQIVSDLRCVSEMD